MERSGYVAPIQGGGTGAGFEPPQSLILDEPVVFSSLIRSIVRRATVSEESTPESSSTERLHVWNLELKRRLFFLSNMKQSNSETLKDFGGKAVVDPKKISVDRQEMRSSLDSELPGSKSNNVNLAFTSFFQEQSNHPPIETRKSSNSTTISPSIVQFLPRCPRKIEDLIRYWRFGCPASLNFPVKKFKCPRFRKMHVPGYSDKKWRSGHRQLFERYEILVKIVAMSGESPISDVYCDTIEESAWRSSTRSFQNQWNGKALTAVIKEAKRRHSLNIEGINSDVGVTENAESSENERFKKLSEEEERWFETATTEKSDCISRVQIHVKGVPVLQTDLQTLCGEGWLNDQIVNSFATLINYRNREYFETILNTQTSNRDENSSAMDHEKILAGPRPRTYMFNSFFFTRLKSGSGSYNYSYVKNWTARARVDVLSLDLLLIPVNIRSVHWVLGAIDIRGRKIMYIDTMRSDDSVDVKKTLQRWIFDEIKYKYGSAIAEELSIGTWDIASSAKHTPLQSDSSSCGVLMLYIADYLELGRTIDFTQEHVPILRRRTAFFLHRNRLADHPILFV